MGDFKTRHKTILLFLLSKGTYSISDLEITNKSNILGASQLALVVKNPPANDGDMKDVGSISGLGRSPGGGHGNPLQYSCLENPMDRGAWWAIQSVGS